ncbi:MAG: HAD hydrolase-like protein [Pseudomonadota bacterium]|nr:HAD hydrolase-like protein [Pseudomonadota bacterium]
MTVPASLRMPAPDAITLDDIIRIYEALRGQMPAAAAVEGGPRRTARLADILPHVDALVLDGFGVINLGASPIDGILEFLDEAEARGVAVMVLTNGAGQGADASWRKYRSWGLKLERPQVVSSRDSLEVELPSLADGHVVAALGPAARPLGVESELTFPCDGDGLFDRATAFAFLGSAGWTDEHLHRLEQALGRGGRELLVANPDISAPVEGGFTAEPGYWAARAARATGIVPRWYGKPHGPSFNLVLDHLAAHYGRRFQRRRVAMVGDSLHTDILGGGAAGMQTVLLTGYGLFAAGGADDMIDACGITPDWIVGRL